MGALLYTIIPVLAVALGSLAAIARPPGKRLVSAMQHLAAGVVFAAAATEILPTVMHAGAILETLLGGVIGVALMLTLKVVEGHVGGRVGMLVAVGLDILIDGLVLGLAFVTDAKAGLLLTLALTLEVLFLGMTVSREIADQQTSKSKAVLATTGIALLLPLGTILASPASLLPPDIIAGLLSAGLMALLYLVTEELLTDAHEQPDTPLVTAMFFVGFLGLMLIEEFIG